MSALQTKKVLDPFAEGVPERIRKLILHTLTPDFEKVNGSYLSWYVGELDGYDELDEFLREQGIKDGEEVLILIWW